MPKQHTETNVQNHREDFALALQAKRIALPWHMHDLIATAHSRAVFMGAPAGVGDSRPPPTAV